MGRGRLRGQMATLSLGETTWTITQQSDGTLDFGGNGTRAALEDIYLKALLQEVNP